MGRGDDLPMVTHTASLFDAARTSLADIRASSASLPPPLTSRPLSPEELEVDDAGQLLVGGQRLAISERAWAQLSYWVDGISAGVILRLHALERAFVLASRQDAGELTLPAMLRVLVDEKRRRVEGFVDATMIHATPSEILDGLGASLPADLEAADVRVEHFSDDGIDLELRIYAPSIAVDPRRGDTVNGGLLLRHSHTGESATQVQVYMRRLACSNGLVQHICADRKNRRTRRLSQGAAQRDRQLEQLGRLAEEGWAQLGEKLDSLSDLLGRRGDPKELVEEFITANRRRLSINERTATAIRTALENDELPPTGTAWDVLNALTRVTSHGSDDLMSTRQRQELERAAGAFGDEDARSCPRCGAKLTGAA